MKVCPGCGQSVADQITTCPACGRDLSGRRRTIDDYRIVDVLHEGYSTLLCRAIRERTDEHVMIRLFTAQSGVNPEIAARLQRELEELKKLPGEGFVRHHAIRRSSEGLWYRISEWVDSESWGSLFASGRLQRRSVLIGLLHQMADILTLLHAHGHFIPHLILNDILVVSGAGDALRVKIDFKLSRFIDPKLDRPAPMLKKLLATHPDIVNQRPLDFRSDIWSLAKVFVELLAGDLEIDDIEARVDDLDGPEDLKVLLRVMLADDPDLRPQSMAEIAEALRRIEQQALECPTLPEKAVEALPSPAGLIRRLQKRVRLLAGAMALLIAAGVLAWVYLERERSDNDSVLESYANRYAPAVGFVLVEYWLEAGGTRVYYNLAEGTAFLVDRAGYLLTSRHVVCPWLEDPRFGGAVQYVRMRGLQPVMGYQIYLWFEGTRAFNPAAMMIEGADIADIYFTENAYSTDGSPRVEISGVARPPRRIRQLLKFPLKDDVAVLKVERLAGGITPLPLDLAMDPRKLPKLSRVITLGFPLGSRTQADTVNASVVRGNVRRVFENMFQIDASLHGGNSGGPVIDARGKVIGIVSAVAMDFSQGLVPMATPVWDIGLILPITGGIQLLRDFKAGHAKWNGVIDFSVDASLARIRETAAQGRWAEAMAAADQQLGRNPQPEMVAAAGMLHFCNADYSGARLRFTQSLSMDPEDEQARLMLALIDWLSGSQDQQDYRRYLAQADWRSPAEFQGYLLQVLEGGVQVASALNAWTTSSEKSWLHYVCGLVHLREGRLGEAEELIEQAVLSADPDAWEFLLARARLDEIRQQRRIGFKTQADEQWSEYDLRLQQFERLLKDGLETRKKRQEQLSPVMVRLAQGDVTAEEKIEALEKILDLDPEHRVVMGALAYAQAAADSFPEALDALRAYLKIDGRQTAMRLGLGLLEAEILHHMGRDAEANERLAEYARRTHDPWFLTLCDYLRGQQTESDLRRQAADTPENLLTAFAAAGFWAEGSGDKKNAIRFYREALGAFLDDWIEYDFVRERVKRLKRSAGE